MNIKYIIIIINGMIRQNRIGQNYRLVSKYAIAKYKEHHRKAWRKHDYNKD